MKKLLIASALAGTVALTGCVSTNQYQHSSQIAVRTVSNYDADIAIGNKINGDAGGVVVLGIFKFLNRDRFADNVAFGGGAAQLGGFNPLAPLFALLSGLNPTEVLKAAAAQKAIDDNKVDTIVAPRYTVKRTNYFLWKDYKVEVTGFGGNVKGFRHIDAEKLAK
jgi:hypothetical protein